MKKQSCKKVIFKKFCLWLTWLSKTWNNLNHLLSNQQQSIFLNRLFANFLQIERWKFHLRHLRSRQNFTVNALQHWLSYPCVAACHCILEIIFLILAFMGFWQYPFCMWSKKHLYIFDDFEKSQLVHLILDT